MKGNAQRMLDHRKDAKGETVAWETQVVPARSPRKQGESSGGDHGKGKEKAGTVLDIDAEDNEEDPATEEDEPMLETALTAAQPRASRPRSAAAARGELESRSSSPSAPSPPPEASTRREEDELSQTQEQSDDAVDEKTEEERAQEEKRRAKEEKLAREKEELESRRQRLANLKATSAPSKVVPAHKKRKF